MDHAMNIAELFAKGGPVVWILAAYSSIGLAIVLERNILFLRLRQLPRTWMGELDRLLDQQRATELVANLKGPEARLIQAVVHANADGVKDLQGVGQRVRAQEIQRMEFGLRTLGILGNTAPLLGLLGTITGMIKAFMVIEQAGGKVDAQALAGGIWEAMITTGVGLAVAIPLLILLHFLEGAVERRGQRMSRCLALLLERRNGGMSAEEPERPHAWEQITDGV
jgi:biopolymer transport protein ExbB